MEKIENYKFGMPYKEKIPKEEANKFATIFGEGSKALTELIEYCILNNIVTLASCKGHPEDRNILDRIVEEGYITFRFDNNYDNDDFAYFLATIPSTNKKIVAHLESNYMSDRTITFYVPAKTKDESEKYFEHILNQLKNYKQLKDNNIEIDIDSKLKKIVDYIFSSWKDCEAFDITESTYKKYERKELYFKKIATCPANSKTKKLHTEFGFYLQNLKEKNFDEFINARR